MRTPDERLVAAVMELVEKAAAPGLRIRRGGLPITRKQLHDLHLKRHDLNEKAMAKTLEGFFSGVVESVADKLASKGGTAKGDDPEAEAEKLINAVWDEDAHLEDLVKTIKEPMAKAFADGALTEYELGKRARKAMEARVQQKSVETKSTASDLLEELGIDWPEAFGTEVPEWVVKAATDAMVEAFEEDYWQDVIEGTRVDLMGTLQHGIREGVSIRDLAAEIKEIRGPAYAQWRATATARTEAGWMLNKGAAAGIKQTSEETGLPMGKEWNSVFGSTSRQNHMDFDATATESPDGPFQFPGQDGQTYEILAPSDPKLPPEDRIACQCFLTSTIVSGELSPDEEPSEEGPPDEAAVLSMLTKHLEGQHDQTSHAGERAGGESEYKS